MSFPKAYGYHNVDGYVARVNFPDFTAGCTFLSVSLPCKVSFVQTLITRNTKRHLIFYYNAYYKIQKYKSEKKVLCQEDWLG